MKKILLLGFALMISFYSTELKSQNIQSVSITSPILCFGDLANINIQINQSSPPVLYKVIVGYYPLPNWFISIASSNNTTVSNINVPGLAAQNYTIRLVDTPHVVLKRQVNGKKKPKLEIGVDAQRGRYPEYLSVATHLY